MLEEADVDALRALICRKKDSEEMLIRTLDNVLREIHTICKRQDQVRPNVQQSVRRATHAMRQANFSSKDVPSALRSHLAFCISACSSIVVSLVVCGHPLCAMQVISNSFDLCDALTVSQTACGREYVPRTELAGMPSAAMESMLALVHAADTHGRLSRNLSILYLPLKEALAPIRGRYDSFDWYIDQLESALADYQGMYLMACSMSCSSYCSHIAVAVYTCICRLLRRRASSLHQHCTLHIARYNHGHTHVTSLALQITRGQVMNRM